MAKTPLVTPEDDWTVDYVFFARGGFTEPARAAAAEHRALLVDLEGLDNDLG